MGLSWVKAAFFVVGTTTATAASIPAGRITPEHKHGKRPAFFLAGDSTTAVDGGWGNGLLAPLIEPAWGVNFGLSGATTASFVAAGRWANVTRHLKEYAEAYDCYVTISVSEPERRL